MLTNLRWLNHRAGWRVSLVSIVTAVVLIPMIYAFERFQLSMSHDLPTTREAPPQPFARIEGPGLIQPPTSGVEGSGMSDDEEVIGVEINGRSRAYRLAALSLRTSHIVNDVVGGVPVSVAFCDMTDCVRVYSDPQGTAPLGFSVGGLYVDNGPEMVLKLDGIYYFHKSGQPIQPGTNSAPIPYERIEPIRTTWKKWVTSHPDTDVYTGRQSGDRATVIRE